MPKVSQQGIFSVKLSMSEIVTSITGEGRVLPVVPLYDAVSERM